MGSFGRFRSIMTWYLGGMRLCVCRRPAHPCADLIADDDVLADRAADDGHADARAVGCARMHTEAHAFLHSSNHHRRDTHTHTLNVTHKQTHNAHTNTQRMHTHAHACTHVRAQQQHNTDMWRWQSVALCSGAEGHVGADGLGRHHRPRQRERLVRAAQMSPPLAGCVCAIRMFAKRFECRPPSDLPRPVPLPRPRLTCRAPPAGAMYCSHRRARAYSLGAPSGRGGS
jgi:hypothetical protein